MAASHVRLTEKIGIALVDVPRLAWAMRPGWMSCRTDRPWVYYSNINRPVGWDRSERGALCGWFGTTDLWVSTVFPRFGYQLLRRTLFDWPIKFADTAARREGPIDVSFVIGHRGRVRLPLLLASLQTIAAQADACIECLVVEQSNQPEIRELLPDWVRYIHTALPKDDMPYCRSWALNVGARAARGSIVVLHDGDVGVPMHYAREIMRVARQGYQVMRLLRFRFDLDSRTSNEIMTSRRFPMLGSTEMIFQNFSAGTSIAVDRETYFALGGYDEEFVGWGPEDHEFFQRCRQARMYEHMYLPFIHFYHPLQPTRGSQAQSRNQELFEARSDIPAQQRICALSARRFGSADGPDPEYPSSSAPKAPKRHLVLVTYGLPRASERGNGAPDLAILRRMAEEYNVILLSVLGSPAEIERLPDVKPFCAYVHTVGIESHSPWERIYGVFDGLVSRRPLAFRPFFYHELFLALRDIVRHWPVDIVHIGAGFLAPYIEAVSAEHECRKILLLNDSDVTANPASVSGASGTAIPLWKLRQAIRNRRVTRYLKNFDHVLARRPMQRRLLLAKYPDLPTAIIEDSIDASRFRPLPEPTEPHTILFVSGAENGNFADAALQFCGEVLTDVESVVPDVKVVATGNLDGAGTSNRFKRHNLMVVGTGSDLNPYYEKAAICIMALGGGSRLRGEMLKAMALGRPVIVTSTGCEGLNVKHGETVFIADSAKEFAGCALRLFEDRNLRLNISEGARNLVKNQYDSAVIGQKLMNIYGSLL